VNLAVLQQFFNDSQLGELAENTLLTEKLRVSLPKFKTFDHKFKRLLSSDETDKYNLEKIAERVRNDSTVYHHLADVVAAEMDEIGFDDDEYLSLKWHSPSWWFKRVSFVASLISLLLALYLLYRVHVLGSALSIIHTARAQQMPRELLFSKPGK